MTNVEVAGNNYPISEHDHMFKNVGYFAKVFAVLQLNHFDKRAELDMMNYVIRALTLSDLLIYAPYIIHIKTTNRRRGCRECCTEDQQPEHTGPPLDVIIIWVLQVSLCTRPHSTKFHPI
jgi:hypothetical protein